MAGGKFTGQSVPINLRNFTGGLNSTAGSLGLENSESSDLRNVDFNKFGSITKRNGYTHLNSTAISSAPTNDGLHWYEAVLSSVLTRKAITVADGKLWKMDDLDGTWDNITESSLSLVFTGAGLNDATAGGTYSGVGYIEYKIVIDATGTPDTFQWFKDGVSQAAGVSITGGAQTLDNGLTITFSATTGHTLNNQWIFNLITTITESNYCDFENFLNEVYITNNVNAPFKWDGSGNSSLMSVPTGLTKSKFVKQFNNYLFLANVTVSGTVHQSRIYWSNIKNAGTWDAANFIEVAKDDGQDITGLRVLSDRLVIYKRRSIYNLFFTGDSDIPFILPGGGKSNSAVGCVAPFSIQELENGHIFLSYDGWYFYDGLNSYKISEKITTTFLGVNTTRLDQARSCVQKSKNRYLCSLPSASQTENDLVFVFDIFNNAWSIYDGMECSSMMTAYVDGTDERPYFGDYAGYIYRMDTGSDDYPSKVQTAINWYYSTNWIYFDDLVDQKGVPHIYVYYQSANSVLTISYSFDFESSNQFSNTMNMSGGTASYGSAIYGEDVYAAAGGKVQRRDLTGRGRVVRFTFSNGNLSETVQLDGIGIQAHLETDA